MHFFLAKNRYRIEEYKRGKNIKFDSDGNCIMKTICPNDRGLISFILSFGDEAEVLSPLWLREKIKDKIESALKKYDIINHRHIICFLQEKNAQSCKEKYTILQEKVHKKCVFFY